MNIAVLASGKGTNLQAIIDALRNGRVKAAIAVVLSDNKEAYALKRAKEAGIEGIFVDPKAFDSKEDFDRELIKHLKRHEVGLVALAGYMRILSPCFIREYKNRIMNIHPALLPSFKGSDGVKDALDYGVKVTGATVHFVTDDLDAGPVISQSALEVDEKDTEETLREKIHKEEHRIYPEAVADFAAGRLEVRGRRVIRRKK